MRTSKGPEAATGHAVATNPSTSGPQARAVTTDGTAELWLVPVRPNIDWPDLLDEAEQVQAANFVVEQTRLTFITSRVVQRLVGARYLRRPPESLTIERTCEHCGKADLGRPRFPGAPFDYSVSHTADWMLVAVIGRGRIGVDIESHHSLRDVEGFARRTLTPDETAAFNRMTEPGRTRWFFQVWTRKEAAMKVSGLGLRVGPDQLDVRGSTATVESVPGWPSSPVWLYDVDLDQLQGPPWHSVSLASTVPVTAIVVGDPAELPGYPPADPGLLAER
ncbi:hypothetical protein DQ384_29075 [Sphaerisporangium album]|uniref:4'-phosphopantetheinyl transferase domain-containing protein n=1 Tax=Sphaerisporangium album TaxID=509200 RepID=A0A367F805_9ACTN|nr:4'-phosphopantetheinyl transferase superfamily protein [Sphaerisporangium album]RCG26498.1 hypothetical protein DQ384_29075 [Sphaerisporangium album]